MIPDPNFVILYVRSPADSAAFYERLLERPPIEASPTFAMFALHEGTLLGLWSQDGVAPPPQAAGGGAEIGFTVGDAAAVTAIHAAWLERGLEVIQAPTDMDFGRTFVAVDPNGHRLRVFAPGGP